VGAFCPDGGDDDVITTGVSQQAPPDWDDYVLGHADANAFQLASAVLIGNRAFGLPAHFITARDSGGRLRGVLPLVEQTMIPWTRCLVSLPFCTYGGPLADDDEALASLVQRAEVLGQQRGAARIILRHVGEMQLPAYPASLDKVSMVLALPGTMDELAKRVGSKMRSQIRRAEREKPQVRVGHAELMGDFYRVFCSVMRDLGTPVYPKRFFDVVFDALGTRAAAVVIYLEGVPVSGAVMIHWRDRIKVPWASTLHSVNPMSINMRLYWELLQVAIERQCSVFDFGRCTREGGTYRFKAQWGGEPVQLYWRSHDLTGVDKVSAVLDQRSKLESAVKIWSKLPLSLANRVGPIISPRLPW
jgi:FemAB-related protein (PEP-CTERM system-associated)